MDPKISAKTQSYWPQPFPDFVQLYLALLLVAKEFALTMRKFC